MDESYFKEIVASIYSLDDYDYADLENRKDVKECRLCHKLFYPEGRNSSRQKYCKRTHIVNCIICGEPIPQREASEKYGTVKFTCSKECANKAKIENAKKTMIEKYGFSNPSQVPELKEKISKALKAKAPETTKKIQSTMKEKYGGMGTASPILREKIENTIKEKYGVDNVSHNQEIREKISKICKSPEYQAKYMATALANWGVTRPSKTDEVKLKMKQTSLERYGVECSLQTEYAKKRFEESCMNKYGVPNVLQSDYARQRARESFIANKHKHNNKISVVNQETAEYLEDKFNFHVEFEKYLGRYAYDLEIVGKDILIEIDPSYTHSDLPNHWCDGVTHDYHLKKTIVAENAGYRCIHIFDWDDMNKVFETLKDTETIYARKCSIVPIDNKIASQFLNNYHIQGSTKSALYSYGLVYNGDLVQVITFGKARYNKHYEWELLRLCSKSGLSIIGGASKLFNKFISVVNPKSIISYCDRAKFTGNVYTKIGMNLHHVSEPAKVWSKGTDYRTDNLLRQRGYDQLFGTNYGKGTSNELLMVENGWRSIYDCGQLVFEWINR